MNFYRALKATYTDLKDNEFKLQDDGSDVYVSVWDRVEAVPDLTDPIIIALANDEEIEAIKENKKKLVDIALENSLVNDKQQEQIRLVAKAIRLILKNITIPAGADRDTLLSIRDRFLEIDKFIDAAEDLKNDIDLDEATEVPDIITPLP